MDTCFKHREWGRIKMGRISGKGILLVMLLSVSLIFFGAVILHGADPVGDWMFDEGSGSTAYDETANDNDGTLTNMSSPACWVDDMLEMGYALEFDGVDDYVSIPYDSSLDATSAVTVEAWIKPDTRTGAHIIACKGNYTYFFYTCMKSSTPVVALIIGKDGPDINTLTYGHVHLDSSKWYHVAGTYQDGIAKLYVNGMLDGMTAGDDVDIRTNNYGISIGSADSYASTYYYQGVIDQLKVYTQELKQSEIRQATVTGEWKFDEASGSSASDETDFQNDGTLTNMNTATCWVSGKSGSALEFDGVDDYVLIPHDASLDITQELTIEAWIKPDTSSGAHVIACKGSTTYFLAVLNGKLILYIGKADPTTWNVLTYGDTEMDSSKWYHVAGTYKDGVGKVYVNGILDGTATGSDLPIRSNTSSLSIGSAASYTPTYYKYNGVIDEFKIHRIAFSESELRRRYYSQDMRGSWEFDDVKGSGIAADDSGNGNTGTLTNMTTSTCWLDGRVGRAVDFDGTNDYVDCGDDSSLEITDEVTVEAWVKPDTSSGSHVIACKGSYTYYLSTNSGNAEFKVGKADRSGWNVTATGTTSLDSDRYYHIAGTYKDGVGKVYVNGTAEDTDTGSNEDIGSYTSDLSIGADSSSSSAYFDGVIDQVNVYARELSSTEVNQRFTDHGGEYGFGCEEQPTGDPVGGGSGYSDILSMVDADYYVNNQTELTNAINSASSGEMIFIDYTDIANIDLSGVTVPSGVTMVYDVAAKTELLAVLDDTYLGDKVDIVFIDGSVTIDLTGENNIVIPEGVTLASDRGYNSSSGALLKTDTLSGVYNYPLFKTGGSNVRITGLRLQGAAPDKTSNDYSDGIRTDYPNLEVDNCEISAFGHAGIYLFVVASSTTYPTNAYIHHNYFHHIWRSGAGYGVSHGYGLAESLVEANHFKYMRHCIAATGDEDNSYEARYNLVEEAGNFDMHGGADREDGTNIAGDCMYVHHNTVKTLNSYCCGIRGVPETEALIYNNWIEDCGALQSNSSGNVESYRNLYSTERFLIIDDFVEFVD